MLELVKFSCVSKFDTNTKKNLLSIYNTCFNSQFTKIENCLSSEKNTINFILLDKKKNQTLFLVTLNKKGNSVVFWNICKHFKSKISAYHLLKSIINDYILENTEEFANLQKIYLALECFNPYLIPSLKTYCRLGFRIDKTRNNLLGWTFIPYISMSLNIENGKLKYPNDYSDKDLDSVFHKQLNLLISKCKYIDIDKLAINKALEKGKGPIHFSKSK